MRLQKLPVFLVPLVIASCSPGGARTPPVGPRVVAPGDDVRPQYAQRGDRLVYAAGEPGRRRIRIRTVASGAEVELAGQGDDVDPTFAPDGRIVFASNRDGDYDLYLVEPATGAVERLTDLEGDEVQPTVAAIPFGFYAVHNGGCGSGPGGTLFDVYHKVLFVRRTGAKSEIWFSSIQPKSLPSEAEALRGQAPSPHGAHQARVSPAGKSCAEPAFAPDGLSAVWSCEGRVEDAPAKYEQSFAAALAAVDRADASPCRGSGPELLACLTRLHRTYATYPGRPVSSAALRLAHPSVATNQTLLVADADGKAMVAPRFVEQPKWEPLAIDAERAASVVWSPTGAEVAYVGAAGITRAKTDYYLQTVRNLDRFPELFGARASERLGANRFVVRPAEHREFYVLHEELRYARRPQFVSTDVALQAFNDELLRLLQDGERRAAADIRALTRALYQHYAARASAVDRYYAVLFATAWVPLEAAATMERLSAQEVLEAGMDELGAEPGRPVDARLARLRRPVAERLAEELPRVVARLPPALRVEVRGHLDRMLAHAGLAPLRVPGRAEPLLVDYSQFAIRGAYAENDLGGYFLAMSWLGIAPLPLDPSLRHFVTTLRALRVAPDPAPPEPGDEATGEDEGEGEDEGYLADEGDPDSAPAPAAGPPRTAFELWRSADAVVGSFMGRPVDATLEQLAEELDRTPGFNAADLERRLLDRRGPVPIRDANNADRALFVTLFPRRVGLDVTFFRALTHPAVEGRGMPSSLDVFATLGNARARAHALEAAGALHDRYLAALDALAQRTRSPGAAPGFASTDLYHSWLALLTVAAAPPALPTGTRLAFAASPAWHDRQLYSALAGYTQLKHAAVLYAMQDMGVECDGDTAYFVAVERPIEPRIRGFVEPNVAFYDALAALARESYRRLSEDPRGPNASQWADESEPRLNALTFAEDLAAIARSEVAGAPLTDAQAELIEYIGGRLEPLTLGMQRTNAMFSTGGNARQERGVALVTDIHTNTQRREALEIGIGRIFDLWVVVPDDVGERLTQGGVLSFYELTAPLGDRLTDAEWSQRVGARRLPPRPPWTTSFIEDP